MKKHLIVMQYNGNGMRFTYVSRATEQEADKFDGSSVGTSTLYSATILSGEDGDVKDMVITIPYIYKCPEFRYNVQKDVFE